MDRESFLNIRGSGPMIEAVETPHGTAYVREMMAGEKDRFEAEQVEKAGQDFRARLIVATCCDESGKLLFTARDVAQVSALPALAIDPVVKAAIRINKLLQEDVDDLRKKSDDPDDDDSSDTREPLDSPHANSRAPSRALS